MQTQLYKPKRHWKEIELWKDVTEEQWNDWLWQLTNTIRTLDDLKKVIHLTPEEEEGVKISAKTIPLNITPYYASLMDPDDPRCPIRMQSVPIAKEQYKTKYDLEDPLHEYERICSLIRNKTVKNGFRHQILGYNCTVKSFGSLDSSERR
jgi:lysine 2,3-aminomutase